MLGLVPTSLLQRILVLRLLMTSWGLVHVHIHSYIHGNWGNAKEVMPLDTQASFVKQRAEPFNVPPLLNKDGKHSEHNI